MRYIRWALRRALAERRLSLIVITTLALGIGPNSLIFSLVSGILLERLPYHDSNNVLLLQENNLRKGVDHFAVAPANYIDWRSGNHTLAKMGAFRTASFNIATTDDAIRVSGVRASAEVFSVLNVNPAIGRYYSEEEDAPGAHKVLLSYGLWQQLGADPQIVGRILRVDGEPNTVLGVMPRGFYFPTPESQMWVPLALSAKESSERTLHTIFVVARPKAGVSHAAVRADLHAIADRLQAIYSNTNKGAGVTVVTVLENTVGGIRSTLYVLFGAVGFVLIIACVNVSNLLIARDTARKKEFAVRIALGAESAELLKLPFVENLVVAFLGATLGTLLAYAGLYTLKHLGPSDIPRLGDVSINAWVVAVTATVCLLSTLLITIGPIVCMRRVNLSEALNESGRGSTSGRSTERMQLALVSVEFGLSFILLIGAGLFIKTLEHLRATPVGFQPDNVLTMRVDLPLSMYSRRQRAFFDKILADIAEVPGVSAIGTIDGLPLSGYEPVDRFLIQDRTFGEGELPTAVAPVTSPGYFRAMRIPLLQGRFLSDQDSPDSPPVVLISAAMAKQFWPGETPIGRRIKPTYPEFQWCTIVGVVGDVRQKGISSASRPTVYYNYRQIPGPMEDAMLGRMNVVVRTLAEPMGMASVVREQIRSADRTQPVFDVRSMSDLVSGSLSKTRFNSVLITAFSAEALVLAVVGIYGLNLYVVDMRRRDIAIRMALGGQRRLIASEMMVKNLVAIAIAIIGGIAGALALSRVIAGLLFGVSPLDPSVLALAAMILTLVSIFGSLVPIYRATLVDPMTTLRNS